MHNELRVVGISVQECGSTTVLVNVAWDAGEKGKP